ncbi:MAG: putative rane protein [Actinomycetia bacterium]|nr:putative rane protein [Actinomycetes bacterium]
MASSNSKARTAAQQRARAQAKKAAARTAPSVRATPTGPTAIQTARPDASATAAIREAETEPEENEAPAGRPLWFEITTLALAIIGLGISAYETYAHYNGSHLLGCSGGVHATFDCTAVITSSQSMVFGVIPVAILGLAFYVVAIPLFSPWGWRWKGLSRLRLTQHTIGWSRLGSAVVGMGFVMYLIYAEVYQIGNICEYCTGVHIVTFLLFCLTVVAAALWGLGDTTRPASR